MAGSPAETRPLMKDDDESKVFSEDSDPELEKNGGIYQQKYAFLQVTFRRPVQSPLDVIALIYGFLPFIVPVVFLIVFIVEFPAKIGLYGFSVSITCMIMNELIFKPIVKDPRPTKSANKFLDKEDNTWKMKPGMPSGHVLNATTIMIWSLMEVALKGPGYDAEHIVQTECWLAGILVLMAPVPWARWRNKDHTLNQCMVAIAIGIPLGALAYVIRINFIQCKWMPWEEVEDPVTPTIAPEDATRLAEVVTTSLSMVAAHGGRALRQTPRFL
jgi:hypothetical protein